MLLALRIYLYVLMFKQQLWPLVFSLTSQLKRVIKRWWGMLGIVCQYVVLHVRITWLYLSEDSTPYCDIDGIIPEVHRALFHFYSPTHTYKPQHESSQVFLARKDYLQVAYCQIISVMGHLGIIYSNEEHSFKLYRIPIPRPKLDCYEDNVVDFSLICSVCCYQSYQVIKE